MPDDRDRAREGALVIVNGRTQERVEQAIHASGAAHGIAADLGTVAGARLVTDRFTTVDILVNNLGIFEPKPFDQKPDDWRRFSRRTFSAEFVCGVGEAAEDGELAGVGPCRGESFRPGICSVDSLQTTAIRPPAPPPP